MLCRKLIPNIGGNKKAKEGETIGSSIPQRLCVCGFHRAARKGLWMAAKKKKICGAERTKEKIN
jgi:hypothetical protein